MKKNIGSADRVIRVLIAVIIAILYFTHVLTGTLGIILLIIGGLFLVTAAIGICPIYLALGLSTNKKEKAS